MLAGIKTEIRILLQGKALVLREFKNLLHRFIVVVMKLNNKLMQVILQEAGQAFYEIFYARSTMTKMFMGLRKYLYCIFQKYINSLKRGMMVIQIVKNFTWILDGFLKNLDFKHVFKYFFSISVTDLRHEEVWVDAFT